MGPRRLWRSAGPAPAGHLPDTAPASGGADAFPYTVGAQRSRSPMGLPGTDVHYTTYSAHHASSAALRHAARPRPAAGHTAAAQRIQAPARTEPVLPEQKMVLGALLAVVGLVLCVLAVLSTRLLIPGIPLLVAGAGVAALGASQRGRPMWQVRVLLHRARREPALAGALLDEALAVDPENPEALAAAADQAYAAGDWARATDLFRRYHRQAPADWVAQAHLGRAALMAGRPDEAAEHLGAVRQMQFPSEDMRVSVTADLAVALVAAHDPAAALELMRTVPLERQTLDEPLQRCLFVRALATYDLGLRGPALEDLARLQAVAPDFPDLASTGQAMAAGTYVVELPGRTPAPVGLPAPATAPPATEAGPDQPAGV